MNSLNLRVSSVKSGENRKKNSELRKSILSLPVKYSKPPYDKKSFVEQFLNATSISGQVNVVKDICEKKQPNDEILQFLADLYFSGPLKHPVRNQISKLLQQYDVSEALHISLIDLLTSTETSCQTLNTTISSLSGCFENFPKALLSLKQNIDRVLSFLLQALQKFNDVLSFQSSPSVKNEFYLFIHNNIRFTLSCVQEFLNILPDESKKQLEGYREPIKKIILNADIPMDVKTNTGILTAYITRILAEYEIHVRCVAEKDSVEENDCLALCLSVGVINTIDIKSFICQSKEIEAIFEKIVDITNRHSTEPCMLLAGTRILFQVSKILLSFETPNHLIKMIRNMLKTLTQFVFSYVEHNMDSVRHICKDLLRNILNLEVKLKFNDLIDDTLDFCVNDGTPTSLKCIILISISNVIGTEIILAKWPTLFVDLFRSELGTDLYINNCYENLMIGNHKENGFEKWKTIWILPLIELGSNDRNMLPTVQNLINKAIKCDPKVVDFLVNVENSGIPLSTRFSALWTIRKNGLGSKDFQMILNGFTRELQSTMISNDDDSKIMALRLIVDTHKTTEELSDIECDILLEFLKYNSNCQSPAIREKSLALISKGLVRLQISFEKVQKENNERQEYYRNFLKKLIELLVGNLFIGANFSRRSVSLVLLKQSMEIALNSKEPLNNYVPNNCISTLIDTLNDSYEANKAIAVSILKLLADENDSYLVSLHVIKELMTSVRPTDSLTSVYYLEYYCNHTKNLELFNVKETPENHVVIFYAVSWCSAILEEGLQIAQNSILLAARTNPLYGPILAIRHLLSKIDFCNLTEDCSWRRIISKLIELCEDLTQVVGPIVNSSSPEGHLPNDFSEITDYFGTENKDINGKHYNFLSSKQDLKSETLKTTPQMVLLCAWRTVKEVSLLLGQIVLRSPIKSQQQENYLLTANQIIQIGSHFKALLSETKHRGAFEQAYVGFLKLCMRLWRVEHSELHQLPMMWLNDLINVISNDDRINDKICATRRSAGVPFMVQALIISELQMGTTKALTYCMKYLISLCSSYERSTESRTHALNIMRALFRCTDLNDAASEHVAEGVMCAIRGYTANTWSEQNSATLLFSALITRIFGVQRTKDSENLDIRNKMTGRIFFLRYPQLYDFFLFELEAASTAIKRHEKTTNLHSLLLLLSRLYPSALEGTESYLKLSSFIDLISVCSGSPEMATRVLASKAIVAFINRDVMEDRILKVTNYIRQQTDSINLNYTHGLLLQVFFMVSSKQLDNKFIAILLIDLTKLFSILKPNPVTWKTLLDIILAVIKRFDCRTMCLNSKRDLSCLHSFPQIYNPEFSAVYPVFRKSLFVYNLYLASISSYQSLASFLLTSFTSMISLSNEEIETCLNVALLIFYNSSKSEIIMKYECIGIEADFIEFLGIDLVQCLRNELRSSKAFKKCLKCICSERHLYPECTIKAYALLSKLPISITNLNGLILEANQHPDDVKDAIARCVEKCLEDEQEKLDVNYLKICLPYLRDLALPWNTDSLRLIAAKIVRHIAKPIFGMIIELDAENLITFIDIILCLSRDEDLDVRDHIAKTIIILSNETFQNISACYAVIVFARYLSRILRTKNDDDFIKSIIKGIVMRQYEDAQTILDDGTEQSEVFDKNEANAFAEPYKTIVDCLSVFSKYFSDKKDVFMYINSLQKEYLR